MDIKLIRIRNFLSHKNSKVYFNDGLTGLIGLNGSGKSSLVKDSVTWALWGKARSGGAGDDLIHYKEDKCSVEVFFDINGDRYSVSRSRIRNKKTTLEFAGYTSSYSEDMTRPTLKDTQEDINKVLGMNYDIFRNSCCIEQGQADSFSKLTPKQASYVILSILQLDKYDAYKTEATNRHTVVKAEYEKVSNAKSYVSEKLKEILHLEQQVNLKKQTLDDTRNVYKDVEKGYTITEAEQGKVQATYNSTILKTKEFTVKQGEVNKNLSKLAKSVDLLDKSNSSCPICLTKLSDKTKLKVREKLRKEYQDLLEQKTNVEAELDTLQNTSKLGLESLKHITDILKEKRDKITELYSVITGLKGEIKALQETSFDSKAAQDKLAQHDTVLEALNVQQIIYSELANAFSHKGIPLLIIENTLRELEVLVNDNLRLLSDLPISIRLVTQRESSTGDLLDTFQIMIQDGIESRLYFNYSGGERMIIDLAIRLGLSELLARRNNFKVETLIIDEGLGSLDEVNQINLVNTLNRLTTKFKKIILITHTEAKDYLSNYIKLVKENNVSKVLDKTHTVGYTDNREETYEISK